MESIGQKIQNHRANDNINSYVVNEKLQFNKKEKTQKEIETEEKVRAAFESLRALRGC